MNEWGAAKVAKKKENQNKCKSRTLISFFTVTSCPTGGFYSNAERALVAVENLKRYEMSYSNKR